MRIRWQSFIEPSRHRQYFELLDSQLQRSFGEGTTHEIIGIDPPDTMLHRLTETRCGMRAVANAVAAEADGCDAFLIGHFQDSGLHEARSAVDIPVLGLGETSMLHACTLGQRIGLVTIDPVFITWHQEQIVRYGLRERVIGVTAMTGLVVEDYVHACHDDDAFTKVFEQFQKVAEPLLAGGAEVLIPAGGLPAMVLSRRPGLTVDGAAVLNPVPVLAKHGEAAVALGRLGLPIASRKGAFALASEPCRHEFLAALS
ncbi:MAG: aspartate/glutamate racemase family protein [Solirubrobacteraceae bacterium]